MELTVGNKACSLAKKSVVSVQLTGGGSGETQEESERLPLVFGKFKAGHTGKFVVGCSKRLGQLNRMTLALDSLDHNDKVFVTEVSSGVNGCRGHLELRYLKDCGICFR